MSELVELKTELEDEFDHEKLCVEYSVQTPLQISCDVDSMRLLIMNEIDNADQLLIENQRLIDSYNTEIDRLTNHADGLDYMVAVGSGVLTGLIDVFLVGKFDFEASKDVVDKKVDKFVTDAANKFKELDNKEKIQKAIENAQKKAAENNQKLSPEKIKEIKDNINNSTKKMDKKSAINYLEKRFPIPSDSVWDASDGITPKSHHLDDLAHHPTVIGLAASILTQFTGNAYFSNKEGVNITKKIEVKTKKYKNGMEIVLIGTDLKTKLICGTINWFGHLLSDLAGSSSSMKNDKLGMGLPGPILSTLKELSMLPILKNTKLPDLLYKLFTTDNLLYDKFRLDFRSELAIGRELGKQAIPVFINEIIVRGFYFIRRFIQEAKQAKSIKDINWQATFPWRNRTITRMLTISLGTFEAIDLGHAAIQSARNSSVAAATGPGAAVAFASNMLLYVNFAGIGRFAIACGTDISMGIKRSDYVAKKRVAIQHQLNLMQAKIYLGKAEVLCGIAETYQLTEKIYNKEEEVWKEIKENDEEMNELINRIYSVTAFFVKSTTEIAEINNQIAEMLPEAEKNNPGLSNILFGGR